MDLALMSKRLAHRLKLSTVALYGKRQRMGLRDKEVKI